MGCQLGLGPGDLRGFCIIIIGVSGWPGPLFYPRAPSSAPSVAIDYAVTVDRMCCSFGFGDYGLEKYQLFCGRAMGPVKQ